MVTSFLCHCKNTKNAKNMKKSKCAIDLSIVTTSAENPRITGIYEVKRR